MADPLENIFDRMMVLDLQTYESRPTPAIAVRVLPAQILPLLERTGRVEAGLDERTVTVDLDLPGLWHGLRVVRLRRVYIEESDSAVSEIHFADPPERVRTVLNRAGFRLPRVGQWRGAQPGQEVGASRRVEAIEGGAALACAAG